MSETSPKRPKHCVAVVGGATAGAEVASRLAERGIEVVVFEQNVRPYGKIEDGLPRWHSGLRRKEYERIEHKLAHPLIEFVPTTRIGRDIDFGELADGWGFTSVVLASGAWRDRPLPVADAERYVGKGLVYQNPFVVAFNHMEDPHYDGPRFEILDDTMVIGGGLASIDVAKIHTLELARRALAERGIEVPISELEVRGIPKTLAQHELSCETLGLHGCTIYYRRRIEDMPLMSAPEGASPEQLEKIHAARRRMLDKAASKFMLTVEPLAAPEALLVESGRVVGMRFRQTRVENGRLETTDSCFERRAAAVVSSIGSIPEPIEGIPMKGELFDFSDWTYGRLAAWPSVFSAGNVVTGKGNIVASRKHATQVSQDAIETFLGVDDAEFEVTAHAQREAALAPTIALDSAGEVATGVAQHTEAQPDDPPERIAALLERVAERQRAVGYSGELADWLEKAGAPS